ncbi:hypothetical protein HCN44_010299 [Aphidius gifuensis]|uniref:Chitin-binding type-4 domain-containing protein n=1 Tax=Aphidius gifuensis TaxID=684658 RepID=A0A835CR88_APHGI|nr:uncharacterized protein LOC122851883 [Aphidius gifuensis]KAF7993704.1 hypothetical protein HCN44_010299 [Aphidius gifuensis]
MRYFLSLAFLAILFIIGVSSHGRLIEPPSRASMWRYGFDTPHDYNDHECYCGGFTKQWVINKGKCGICGDPWDSKPPRVHETGGKYGNSVIVRKYKTGDTIPVRVELTANHFGYFEFRVCPMKVHGKEVTQECLDKHVLLMEDKQSKYYPGPGNRIFEGYFKLPDDLTCAQCVFQWKYIAGNNWGDCGNNTSAVGCGPQEEFRACADIAIGDNLPPLPTRPPSSKPTKKPYKPTEQSNQTSPEFDDTTTTTVSSNWWFLPIVIASTGLIVTLAILALLYAYYYHIAGRAKLWLKSRRLAPENSTTNELPPVAPPRQKRTLSNNLHL